MKELKELRVSIDALAQLTEVLKPINIFKENEDNDKAVFRKLMTNSEQIEKAVDSLYLAKAWVGKMLGEIGEETPYKNDGKRKSADDIEPTDAVATKVEDYPIDSQGWGERMKDVSHVEKVDWLRQQIQAAIDNTQDFSETYPYIELEQGFVYKYLCEARFWLGFELGRIYKAK